MAIPKPKAKRTGEKKGWETEKIISLIPAAT